MAGHFIDHDMTGGNQVEELLVQIEESRGIGQRLVARKSQDLCDSHQHDVNHLDLNVAVLRVIREPSVDVILHFNARPGDSALDSRYWLPGSPRIVP